MKSFSDLKTVILPNIKKRLSSSESVPYSSYIIGAESIVKREAPLLNHRTSGNYYKPQKKQYTGVNKMNYMIQNLDLKQPRFTYLPLKQKNNLLKVYPQKLRSEDLFYSGKKDAYILRHSLDLKKNPRQDFENLPNL